MIRTPAPPRLALWLLRMSLPAALRDPVTGDLLEEWRQRAPTSRRWFWIETLGLVLRFLLAAVGIYGVMAYSVTQRTREFGVRLALGAQRGDVLGLMLRRGLLLTGTGVAIGLCGALALGRLVQSLLFNTSASDPATLTAVALLLALVALLAAYVPARRATRVDPVTALRCE